MGKHSNKIVKKAVKSSSRPVGKLSRKVGGNFVKGVAQGMGIPTTSDIGKASRTLGRNLGAMGAKRMAMLIGQGDYQMTVPNHNSLMKGPTPIDASFQADSSSVRIRHREFIGDIRAGASGTTSIVSYAINPSNYQLFTTLPNMAACYEEYRFSGLVFEFQSMVTEYSSVPSLGIFGVGCQYNAAEAPWTSRLQVENADGATSSKPSQNLVFGVECKDQPTNGLYVSNVGDTTPVNLQNMGNLYTSLVNTGAYANGTAVYEMWVTYDVIFRKPRNPIPVGYFHRTASGVPPANSIGFGNLAVSNANTGGLVVPVRSGMLNNISWADTAINTTYTLSLPVGTVFSMSTTVVTVAGSTVTVPTIQAITVTGANKVQIMGGIQSNANLMGYTDFSSSLNTVAFVNSPPGTSTGAATTFGTYVTTTNTITILVANALSSITPTTATADMFINIMSMSAINA